MKKYIIPFVLVLVILIFGLVFFFNNKDIKININNLANDLIKNVKFEDELNMIDRQTVKKLYNIDNFLNEVTFMSSGATAEEIAILEFVSEKKCKVASNKVKLRVEEQKENFKDYMPKEMKKLNDAIIIRKDKYLIVCITNDRRSAEKIINKYIE